MVGAARFELAASRSQTVRTTRLCYAPDFQKGNDSKCRILKPKSRLVKSNRDIIKQKWDYFAKCDRTMADFLFYPRGKLAEGPIVTIGNENRIVSKPSVSARLAGNSAGAFADDGTQGFARWIGDCYRA